MTDHGVERHLRYVVCVKNKKCDARYIHTAWCGASPAICCVSRKWRMWCMILSYSMV